MWKKIKDSKWLYVILSVFLSVVLWGYVYQEADPAISRSITNIPVNITGGSILRSRNLIITEGFDQVYTLELEAKAATFTKLNRGTITLSADVSKIVEPGKYDLNIEITPPINVNFTEYTINNSQDELYITVTVSKLDTKEIPVYMEFTGSVARGYQAGEYSVSPSMVSITGEKELVNQVANAKVVLAQRELKQTYSGDLSFVYMGSDGKELIDLNVESNVDTVHVIFPIVKSKEVPLTLDVISGGGASEENAEIVFYKPNGEEISTIDITGPEEELDLYKELNLGEVNLADVEQTKTYTFPVQLPEGFTNESGITEVTASVTITGLVIREFKDVDNIQIANCPEGYVAELVTESRMVTIRGSQEAVDAVYRAQLQIIVDLSNAQVAVRRQTVPARVVLSGNNTVGVVGTYSAVVILTPEGELEQEPPTEP